MAWGVPVRSIVMRSCLIFCAVLALQACDSTRPEPVVIDDDKIDEIRVANDDILNARKAKCDDLLPDLQTNQMSQTMWHSLQCPEFYTRLSELENKDETVGESVEVEEPPIVQSGDIEY